MKSLFRYTMPPGPCAYLAHESASMQYEAVGELSRGEYLRLMLEGWRRFGHMLFRPACAACTACRALRVCVHEFAPTRSQRRNRKMNEGEIELRIGPPSVTREKLDLYDRFHEYQEGNKGWPGHPPKDADSYADSFVVQPFPVEEWCYYLRDRLVGVGYVDHLPEPTPEGEAGVSGLSAIYFFWEPDLAKRGLGTWNVLSMIGEARRRGLPYLYLGYYVAGCASMEYKPLFVPNELRGEDGRWRPFRTAAPEPPPPGPSAGGPG
jgi:arginine-tRNA-protein transferase